MKICRGNSHAIALAACRASFLLSIVLLLCLAPRPAGADGAAPAPIFQVGMREVGWTDWTYGARPMVMTVFYPARISDPAAKPAVIPFFANLHLYRDAPVAAGARYPLIMLSHGRGSNGMIYAWLAEYLASRGYIVAAPNHYRANSYDSSIVYLANKIWQRPRDIGLDITWITRDPFWSRNVDAARIGIAGHSQGGFTALWVGGAEVNPKLFADYQRNWRNNPLVPLYLRQQMPVDPAPALDVRDARVKAAFAMAPGIVQAFGMDEAGLRKMAIPAYLTVGASDTQTPPEANAVFAARHIPDAQLVVIPGRVDHEIFANECDQEGRDEFPETCIDAPGIDRGRIHESVGAAAVAFFDRTLGVKR
jgi:predicted dienelactone hydrolase